MRIFLSLAAFTLLMTFFGSGHAYAHCEIPCGIYDDSVRVSLLEEHVGTMEKSMSQIKELGAGGEKNYNQLIRWVTNKEDHANKFQEIVSQYFLTQRIKPAEPGTDGYADYQEQLSLLHQMLVYSMKCKQTTDQANIDKLRELVSQFRTVYFSEHAH